MRIHIVADEHGIAGRVGEDSHAVREQLTREVGAAVEGINTVLDDVVITVGDSDNGLVRHGSLDENASVVKGRHRKYGCLTGAKNADYSFYIGAHGGLNSGSLFEDTFSSDVIRGLSINSKPMSQLKLDVLLLREWDAPVQFVSGDTVACDMATGFINNLSVVKTKQPHTSRAATCYHPQLVANDIRQSVEALLPDPNATTSLRLDPPFDATAELERQEDVDKAAVWPSTTKQNSTTISYNAQSVEDAYQFFQALTQL